MDKEIIVRPVGSLLRELAASRRVEDMNRDRANAWAMDAFRTTSDLFDTGLKLKRQNLRRVQPEASDEEIERQLREWLRHPPWAPQGDGPGRTVGWPRSPDESTRSDPRPD